MHRRGVEDGGRSGGRWQTPGWRRGVSAGEVPAHGFRLESMDMSAFGECLCQQAGLLSGSGPLRDRGGAEHGDRAEQWSAFRASPRVSTSWV